MNAMRENPRFLQFTNAPQLGRPSDIFFTIPQEESSENARARYARQILNFYNYPIPDHLQTKERIETERILEYVLKSKTITAKRMAVDLDIPINKAIDALRVMEENKYIANKGFYYVPLTTEMPKHADTDGGTTTIKTDTKITIKVNE